MTEYRRYQGKSYMVSKPAAAAQGYEYPMLLKNRIPGLLPLQITNEDEWLQFWYDISGKNSLENWAKIHRPGRDFLKKFMTALKDTLEQTGGYLLCEDGISLSPNHIFVDAEEREIAFCYMPFEKMPFEASLRSFMEYYLSHMEHGSGEDTQKCYAVYEKCQEEHTSIDELLQILFKEHTPEPKLQQEEAHEEQVTVQEFSPKPGKKNPMKLFRDKWNLKTLPAKKKVKENISYVFEPGECQTEVSNPTVFLGSETEQIIGELRYEGDGNEHNIKVTAPVFLIGNQSGEADGVIHDETVSRIHARITKEDGHYYIEDMNSTNGTCINGELLNYMEKVMLEKNDRIAFAKESYRFV